jgi:hypothetical protein
LKSRNDYQPGAFDAAVSAAWAAAGWVQCIGCELEPATRTRCGSQLKTIAGGSYALLDVLQIFLEDPYREAQIVTQIVEGPLLGPQ